MRNAIRNSVCFLCMLALCAVVGGCAVGRGADGSPVIGFRFGSPEPESIGEVAGLLGGMLPPPWGQLALGAGGILTYVLGGASGRRAGTAQAGAVHAAENRGWDMRDTEQRGRDADWYEAQLHARLAPVAVDTGNVLAGGPPVRSDEAGS